MKLDRKTQEQIVKELKNCLGSFKSAQPDFLNHEMLDKNNSCQLTSTNRDQMKRKKIHTNKLPEGKNQYTNSGLAIQHFSSLDQLFFADLQSKTRRKYRKAFVPRSTV